MTNATLIILLACLVCSAHSLKCFVCNSGECKSRKLVECSDTAVQDTSRHFTFLPQAATQKATETFYCVQYQANLTTGVALNARGCFFSSYNPCEDRNEVGISYSKKFCKYCNLKDGCNPATRISFNQVLITCGFIFATKICKNLVL